MLVVSLARDESVHLENLYALVDGAMVRVDDVEVRACDIRGDKIRVGIQAHTSIQIARFGADGMRASQERRIGGGRR